MKNFEIHQTAIGKELRKVRQAKGKRLLDVEIETGIATKTLSLSENGKSNTCLETLYRYANYLGLRIVMTVERLDQNLDKTEKEV